MIKEYQLIMGNDVWDVVLRPKGKYILSSMWINKIKYAADGAIKGYKERFMVYLKKRE